jgi:putative DNA primase/helicase
MKSLKLRYTIHVCFSAGNMKKVASTLNTGYVIADNDESKTGENAALDIGWPYWMSEQVGEDANDTHQRLGLFRFGKSVAKLLNARTSVYGSHDQQFAATH